MPSRRGRPSKFGRAATATMLTLPDNVLAWLRGIHADPAWAIVSLFESLQGDQHQSAPRPEVELVQLSGKRALIVINPSVLKGVDGVSMIPLADGRALIALDPEKGVADFELAVVDRLQHLPSGMREHTELTRLRQNLRRWRRVEGLRFHKRSIIVIERSAGSHPIRPLGALVQPTVPVRTPRRRPPTNARGVK